MTATTRVTVLVENTAADGRLLARHGLAYWIDTGRTRLLFDTGPTTEALVHNAERLGIDLGQAEAVVISHGHYDHTGGLEAVLRAVPGIPVFLHPAALQPHFACDPDGTVRSIGMPEVTLALITQGSAATVTLTESPTSVVDGVRVTGEVPRATDFEDPGGPFFLDDACTEPDPIADDQAVFLDTAGGTAMLLGCGHAGVINTLRFVEDLTGGGALAGVMGGMHLRSASQQRIDRTVSALEEMDLGFLAPGHCTGAPATQRLHTEFPGRTRACSGGTRFEFSR